MDKKSAFQNGSDNTIFDINSNKTITNKRTMLQTRYLNSYYIVN
jgi:hypothetical protein